MIRHPCPHKPGTACRLALLLVLVTASTALRAETHYVDANTTTPFSPYTNWATAAQVIQQAVDVSTNGDTVLVTNGVYATGGRAVYGTMTNRVAVDRAVVVRSVNGPDVTVIQGYQVPGTTNGDGAVRCVYLTNGAMLSGFTLTNGATRASGDNDREMSGGGVWCEPTSTVITNCTLAGNSAAYYGGGAYYGALTNCTLAGNSASWEGGGAYQGTLNNCTLADNSADYGGGAREGTLNGCTLTGNSAHSGGGACYSTLNNCTLTDNSAEYGGGASYATLNNCTLTGNLATSYGGGTFEGTLNNCTLTGNSATSYGGGAYWGTLNNCTLTGNSAASSGGGAYNDTLNNCLVYYNMANTYPNYSGGTLNYCCTTPAPGSGAGNITAEPQLASASHLSAGSPCRGAGSAAYSTGADIDGEPWLSPPSIGCDEYRAGAVTGALTVAIGASWTNVPVGFPVDLTAWISGRITASVWDLGDGTVLSNRPYASHAWTAAGTYTVTLRAYNDTYAGGVSATVTIGVGTSVYYVSPVSANPVAPYSSWATAAHTIQDAVDVTVAGGTVWVTNGVYASGGRIVDGTMTNRVAVTRPITVQSVNGPQVTVIQGYQVPGTINGDGAVRCVYLTNGAVLGGFTLTNGATRANVAINQERYGGGVWCASTNAVVTNCVLTRNSAFYAGGGAYLGTLNNCTFTGNSAGTGGGASQSTLNNCTLTGNSAAGTWACGGGADGGTLNNCTLTGNSASNTAGGANASTLNNCIIYYNTAVMYPNYDASSILDYCCTTPLPGAGAANIAAEPELASASHLSANSPCRGSGSAAFASGMDIDGEPWLSPPSIGCDEYLGGSCTGAVTVAIGASWTNVAVGFSVDLSAWIDGRVAASAWDFGDGTVLSNRPYARHAWSAPGDYPVVLRAYNDSYPGGVSATVTIQVVAQPVYYVVLASPSPVSPYTNWLTAATNIQDAVDAASVPGALVLVTNGVYATGGRVASGAMTNRVAVTKAITVQSVNGPQLTVIQGWQVPGTTNGDGAIRCVYLTNGAMLSGFTLTNGATRVAGDEYQEASGGGVWCVSANATITNCTFTGNSAYLGGGAYSGTLNNCTLADNSAAGTWGCGGGAYACILNNCTVMGNSAPDYGGGVYLSTLNNCTLTGNSAYGGGGAYYCTLNNCTLTANSATDHGGGAYNCTLNNCTLTGNSATAEYSTGGGADSSTLNNCALTSNSASSVGGGVYGGTLNNCTLTGNSAQGCGGAEGGTLNNCILYYNNAVVNSGANYGGGTLNYCCTTPLPSTGTNNLTAEPQLANASHLCATSPCRGSGSAAYATGVDIDGEPWLNPPSIGCDEYHSGSLTGAVTVAIGVAATNVAVGYSVDLTGLISGRVSASAWDFGDGTVVSNRPYASHSWSAPGNYPVVLRAYNEDHPGGVSTAVTIQVVAHPVYYVAQASPNPMPPYSSWATAATKIQDAVDVAIPGALVLVTNGVYSNGGRVVNGIVTNRVAVTNAITVQSVNGPQATAIQGYQVPGTTNGGEAIRCVYLTAGAVLNGFTLSNGATSVRGQGDLDRDNKGGGVWCLWYSALVTNCLLTGNSAFFAGGGAYRGTFNNCTFTGNSGGGASRSTLNNCTLTGNSDGGADGGTLKNCTLTENWNPYFGGGACNSTLEDCLLWGNSADFGGGACWSTLINCTLIGNSARLDGSGVFDCQLLNCILYDNTNGNYDTNSTLNNCCTIPLPTNGIGNIAGPPLFLDAANGNYRLGALSPCIDAGQNQAWMFTATDLDGNPRIINGTVDMGAYETPFTLNLRVFLEGPYDTDTHSMLAGNPTNLPATSPYAADPRHVSSIPSNVVDWVLVQLQATNGNTVVAKSTFVDIQGQLFSTTGATGITAEVSAGYYSVLVKHRNHLAVMSAQPVAFTNYLVAYDFTTGADQYNGGSKAAVELEPRVWGMMAGDADGDGEILAVDGRVCTNQLGQTGYCRADFNLDGMVSGADLALWTANEGRTTYATNGETILSPALTISPEWQTLLVGISQVFAVTGTTGAVTWAMAQNPSGATLTSSNATSAVYQAGYVSNCVDIVEAWDGQGHLGRAHVNVISAADMARAGKAIIIAGQKSLEDPVWPETDYLGNLAYNTLLKKRGFSKGNIRYLNPVTDQDVDDNGELDDIALPTTLANVAETFTNWAVNPDRMFVYLVDHGGSSSGAGYFRLNATEVLTAAALGEWLDAIQNRYTNEVVVVIDCCESGSFLEALRYGGPARRTVITACGTNEPTYFVAGGLVSFSDAFFGGLLMGLDLEDSFVLARDSMALYQGALLDADGDGVYAPSTDLALVAGTYIGPSFVAGKDIPQIGHVVGNQSLRGSSQVTLWAYDIASGYPIDRVWCVVVPPGHSPSPTNPVGDLPLLDLAYNSTSGRYEARYSGFTQLGVYKVVYYARDIWESVSPPRESYVTQNGYEERVILVAGGSTNDVRWPAIDNVGRLAYHTFRGRWFEPQDIYYLNPCGWEDADGDGTNDVTALPTLANLQNAITSWASNANKLTVYLVGGGTNGLFRLNASEGLSPLILKTWLDFYQSSNQEATVVMDFAGAGTFVPALVPPPGQSRVGVASSGAGQDCLLANGGTVSFSQYFLSEVFNGLDIGSALDHAREAISRASGQLRQHALLDDNGDGKGDIQDGLIARHRYIGTPFLTGVDMPVLGVVMPDTRLKGAASLRLWVSEVTDVTGVSNVWCVITPPDYQGQGDLPQINLTWNAGTNRYEGVYTNFTTPGTYVCTFYVRNNAGEVSSPKQAEVIVPYIYEGGGAALATTFAVGGTEQHQFDSALEEDWVTFYAPTGLVFNVEARQLGDQSDVRLDLYYEQPDGALVFVGAADNYGSGAGFSEGLTVDLKTGTSGLVPGVYYVRVSSADTNLFGAGSEYELRIYVPIGPGGGVIRITSQPQGVGSLAYLTIHLGPQEALKDSGGWRVPNSSYAGGWYKDAYLVPFSSAGTYAVNFVQIPGWDLVSSTNVSVQLGFVTDVYATYTRSPRLSVSPAGGLATGGFVGGPFAPTSITYALTNSGESPCAWLVSKTAAWLALSPGSGTLAAGASANVTLSVNASANGLAAGTYGDTVSFANQANGLGNTNRSVTLAVAVHPPVRLANPQLLTNGSLVLTLQGVTNRVYSIIVSSNLLNRLTNWTEVLRLTNTVGQTVFTNPPPPSSPRYYRAKEL